MMKRVNIVIYIIKQNDSTMKAIKNVLIFVLLVAGSTAYAQQRCGKECEAPGQRQGCPIIAQLDLSSQQQAELKKIKKDLTRN